MAAETRIVEVALQQRSYPIEIGTGNLTRAGEFLASCRHVSHGVVVTDDNVEADYAMPVAESLAKAAITVDILVVDPGETTKCVDVAGGLWEKFLEIGADRKSVVVAVGGGVIGDLAGFVAATYARGIALLQIPTTLLAQVDSSVGGKVGVNLPGAKNMVGAFWQPLGVIIDTTVLGTLSVREYRAGLGEVVKYGVILDADFFAYFEAHVDGLVERDNEVLRHVIARCCQLKAQVVSQDERDLSGARAVLNYGHTFCHALETLTGYRQLLHGEAVSIGMLCASRLAERLGRVDARLTQRQHDLLSALGLPVEVPDLDHQEIVAVMQRDKKAEYGKLRFVLPTKMGHVELVGQIDPSDVQAALQG